MIPIGDDMKCRRIPFANYSLILVNLLIFAALGWRHDYMDILERFGVVPARLQPVTLLTAMFLHVGFLHLFGNMLFLWVFGDNVEGRLGPVLYVALYVTMGMLAGLVHVVMHAQDVRPAIGASGAISGMLGMYAILYPHSKVRLLYWFGPVPRIFMIPTRLCLPMWFAVQLLCAVLSDPTTSGVGFWAHVGGFVAGFGLGLPVSMGALEKLLDAMGGRPPPDPMSAVRDDVLPKPGMEPEGPLPQQVEPRAAQPVAGAEAKSLAARIRAAFLQNDAGGALGAFCMAPDEQALRLPPTLLMRVAKASASQGDYRTAVRAYVGCLEVTSAPDVTGEAYLQLASIHAYSLRNPAKAREYAEAGLKVAMQSRQKSEFQTILKHLGSAQQEGGYTVLLREWPPEQFMDVARALAMDTQKPLAEVTTFMRQNPGYLAIGASRETAECIALHTKVLKVGAVALKGGNALSLPPVERVMKLEFVPGGLHLRTPEGQWKLGVDKFVVGAVAWLNVESEERHSRPYRMTTQYYAYAPSVGPGQGEVDMRTTKKSRLVPYLSLVVREPLRHLRMDLSVGQALGERPSKRYIEMVSKLGQLLGPERTTPGFAGYLTRTIVDEKRYYFISLHQLETYVQWETQVRLLKAGR